LLTRAWDWLNTPADALVTRKDPLAFQRRLDFYAEVDPETLLASA
jgi:homoserine kinase type II